MKYKVCHIIFSTNRIEYLKQTLEYQKNLDFTDCDVYKLLIDDYPKNRDNQYLESLVKSYGFNEVILHGTNQGLSVTWKECWDLIKNKDFDYIFQQEDDVLILEPIKIVTLIEYLKTRPYTSQLKLARQAWYYHEKDPTEKSTDTIYDQYRIEQDTNNIFGILASLYKHEHTKIPINELYNINPNEGMVGLHLENLGFKPEIVKNKDGKKLVEHIGEYFVGKRVLENEPGYNIFSKYNPDIKYYSRDGRLYDK